MESDSLASAQDEEYQLQQTVTELQATLAAQRQERSSLTQSLEEKQASFREVQAVSDRITQLSADAHSQLDTMEENSPEYKARARQLLRDLKTVLQEVPLPTTPSGAQDTPSTDTPA